MPVSDGLVRDGADYGRMHMFMTAQTNFYRSALDRRRFLLLELFHVIKHGSIPIASTSVLASEAVDLKEFLSANDIEAYD